MGNILQHFFRPRQHQDASFPYISMRSIPVHPSMAGPFAGTMQVGLQRWPHAARILGSSAWLVQPNFHEWNNTDQQWLGKVAEAFKSWGCRGFWQCHALDASWSFLVPKGLNTNYNQKGWRFQDLSRAFPAPLALYNRHVMYALNRSKWNFTAIHILVPRWAVRGANVPQSLGWLASCLQVSRSSSQRWQ